MYQEARIRWPNKVRLENKIVNTWNCILVQKAGTEEEEKEKDAQKREKEKLEIVEAVGLSNLLKKIVDSVSVHAYIISFFKKKITFLSSQNFYVIDSFLCNYFFCNNKQNQSR